MKHKTQIQKSKEAKAIRLNMERRMKILIKRQHGKYPKDKCEDCGTINHLTVHHVKPLSEGGEDDSSNYKILCRVCHDKVHGINTSPNKNKISKSERRIVSLMLGAGHDLKTISEVIHKDITAFEKILK